MRITIYNNRLGYEATYKHVVKITEYPYGGFILLSEDGDEEYFGLNWEFEIDNWM